MGRLIIDGNSFFEIDEECLKKKKVSKRCGLDKYLIDEKNRNDLNSKKTIYTTKDYNSKQR